MNKCGLTVNFGDNQVMNILLIFLSCIFITSATAATVPLRPFATDYCTAYIEGTREHPNLWKHCCEEHDLYFWAGGSLDDRKASDLRLKSCVEKTGATVHAILIYTAVSIGGASPIRFKTKEWGNAWENRSRYITLNESETSSILQHLEVNNTDLSNNLKQSFTEQLNCRLDSK
jgi:hypothetical protein